MPISDFVFGDAAGYLKAPGLIARREGAGAELALGARALAAKYGHPELAMEVKNLKFPGYDPRGAFGMALGYATSDRGACHMRTFPVGQEIVEGTLPPHTLRAKPIGWSTPRWGARTSLPSSSAASGATSGPSTSSRSGSS